MLDLYAFRKLDDNTGLLHVQIDKGATDFDILRQPNRDVVRFSLIGIVAADKTKSTNGGGYQLRAQIPE